MRRSNELTKIDCSNIISCSNYTNKMEFLANRIWHNRNSLTRFKCQINLNNSNHNATDNFRLHFICLFATLRIDCVGGAILAFYHYFSIFP